MNLENPTQNAGKIERKKAGSDPESIQTKKAIFIFFFPSFHNQERQNAGTDETKTGKRSKAGKAATDEKRNV